MRRAHGRPVGSQRSVTYQQRWEEETANDQLKTHLRAARSGASLAVARSLVHQEIWAYVIVHHAISDLTARASAAADLDPDSISFAKALRLTRRTPPQRRTFP